ncbi:hypothetical protein BDR26DRAFT_874445 [Obelidium mucronatum]|nr:hypothetical protein BDR26DRAFT_874445 [Obelidium mucronatum]
MEGVIKELGQVLNQLDRKFCVSGVLPVSAESPVKILFEQDSDKQKSPASFGFNTETVLDANYRKALKLDGSCLATTFDVYSTGVINKIKKALVLESKIKPSSDIHAELHKLNVYGPEGFFKAHSVSLLPLTAEFSHVTRGESDSYSKSKNSDSSKSFDWGPSTKESDSNNHLIQWAAFFSDCPHEISPIVSGTRITLTYNLFKRSLAEEVLLNAEMSLPRDCAFLTQFQAQLSEQFFFESGAVLMFHCQHAVSTAIDSETVIPLLKGADMSVFEAAVACGLQVFVKPLYDGARYTDSRHVVEVDNKKVVWFGSPLKMNRHEYLHYGNEATVGYVYSSAVIMVVVPAWKDLTPNYNAYISYADEFEAEWADPLQYYLGKHGILAHAHKKQNWNQSKSTETKVPRSCLSRKRSEDEKGILTNARTNTYVVWMSTRKLILLKLSGSFKFEAEGEIKELVDALTAVGQSQCISPPQKIAVAVKQDVIPEIMGLQFGDIDGLIELTNRHFETLVSGNGKRTLVPLPKELNAQYIESSYQYAFIMSHVSKQDDKFHKYLKIAADGDHSQKHSAQYFFAKEMENVDPALSFDYYKLSCQQR